MASRLDSTTARIMMKLIETAAADGVISDEEQEILDTIDNSLHMYKKALDDALEDGIVTVEEQIRLEKIRDIVINTARIVAEQSNNDINKDELTLLLGAMVEIKIPRGK